jgi:hypothetical protein
MQRNNACDVFWFSFIHAYLWSGYTVGAMISTFPAATETSSVRGAGTVCFKVVLLCQRKSERRASNSKNTVAVL